MASNINRKNTRTATRAASRTASRTANRAAPRKLIGKSAENKPTTLSLSSAALSEPESDEVLPLRAWLSVVRAYNQCGVTLGTKLSKLGYTIAQYEVLTHLERHPRMTQQELAERCYVAKSGMSMLLKSMEQDRWVKRSADAQDARIKRLTLTALGMQHARKTREVQRVVVGAMAAELGEKDLVRTLDIMQRVTTALQALD
jgi:DNA-binding MarR family transcriptional regulator